MKKISIRNLIITLLCFTVICLAIGFCILSVKLESYKNKKEVFKVVFTDVVEDSFVKGGKVEPSATKVIEEDGHTLNMLFTMNNPLDEVSYLVTIKNKGTLKAKIIDVVSMPDYINDTTSKNSIKPISITKTDISGKILDVDEEATFKVTAFYNQGSNLGIKKIPYKLSLISTSN